MKGKSTGSKAVGQNFYVKTPEGEFAQRVGSWLDYLEMRELFPNLGDVETKVKEWGHQLRDFGEGYFLGNSNRSANEVMIRPGDYVALLHELTHVNKNLEGKLLSGEPGAFALSILATGDFDGELDILFNKFYHDRDKVMGRVLTEACLAGGKHIIGELARLESKVQKAKDESNPNVQYEEITPLSLARYFSDRIDKFEKSFMDDKEITPRDYLTSVHSLTPLVADYLLSVTHDTKETVLRSTCQAKRDVIGAFKSLASFYHINLGKSLEESLARTDQHFKNREALALSRTLNFGAKEVFAKLKEYGYDMEFSKALCEKMLGDGLSKAHTYSYTLPDFMELAGGFGPRGKEIMDSALQSNVLLKAFMLHGLTHDLKELGKSRPDQVPLILDELKGYEWKHAPEYEATRVVHIGMKHIYDRMDAKTDPEILKLLDNQKLMAKMAAFSVYLDSMKEEWGDKLVAPHYQPCRFPSNEFERLAAHLSANKDEASFEKALDDIIAQAKSRYTEIISKENEKSRFT